MNLSTPYFGAAYYPEAWPAGTIEQDIPLMQQAGMNVMRMAEFSWIQLEPQPGAFDFAWLRTVIDRLAEAGIASILATPSATPPVWLTKKHPEILFVDDNGQPRQHGERCHWCPNQPVYREHIARVVEAMAREFGRHPNVVGWQIDNEPYPNRRGCCCPVCAGKFRQRLQQMFGTIARLNETWGTNLWSQRYESFEDFEAPRSNIWHHPSLVTEWMRFQSDSYVEYVALQAAVLRRHTDRPIGTDTMPMYRLNYRDLEKHLDVLQFNHYPSPGELRSSQFWMSYVQSLKDRPFWVTESSTGASAATAVTKRKGCKPENYVRALSWLPVMMGAEAQLYWLWRCHWSGQELMHGSVVDSCGRASFNFSEVAEVGAGLARTAEFLNQTRPANPKVALHFSCDAALTFEAQRLIDGFQYEDFYRQLGKGRGELVETFYEPLVKAQYAVEVIDPSRPLDDYRVVISPFLLSLDESGVRDRLKAWIQAGGTWVVGPMTDIRTRHGTKYTQSPFGVLEEWTGARCRWQIPGNIDEALFQVRWRDGSETGARIWYDVFDAPAGAEVLGVYTNDRLKDRTAAFSVPFGKGKIVVLGTVPTAASVLALLQPHLETWIEASDNLLVVKRTGKNTAGLMIAELEGVPGKVVLNEKMTNLAKGLVMNPGTIAIEPYGVMVLEDRK